MFNPSREQVRQFFCETYRKLAERLPLVGAEATAADVVALHPEYHDILADANSAAGKEWSPEGGETNPFLHLSLHLAIAEQLAIDQPKGIRACFEALLKGHDQHTAEHVVLECLGEALWRAQREARPIDAEAYLEAIRRQL